MKILQLVTKRQYRGAEVFAANLSTELMGFGHEIIFAGLYCNDSDVLAVAGAKNLDLSDKRSGNFSYKLVKSLAKLIKSENPDVVQCNGSDTLKYMVAASFFNPKVPITYRNISTISEWINSPLKLLVYKFLFKKVAHVTSVGSESIEDLINTFKYPKAQTSVIRRGIPIKSVIRPHPNQSLKKALNLKESDKIVMHIGNFSPEKNHEFLLDVFSGLKTVHPDVKLILVGTGITFEEIKRKIREMELDTTVFALGFRKDIPDLLAQADCFALCSIIEGVPGVILEAASQKKPSISTNVGGVNEVLIDNKTGFIIEDFDKKEFSRKLIQLVKNTVLNKEMGEKAYRLVVEEFNPVKNARKFEKLYTILLNNDIDTSPQKDGRLIILQIIQKKQFRGAEVFASQLATHLLDQGHRVEMLSIYNGQAILPFPKIIKTLDRRKSIRGFDYQGWKRLAEIVNEINPDIIQANASDTLKYAVFSKILFRWKAPIIYRNASTSSFYITNSLSRITNAFLLKRVDLILSVCQASLNDLASLFPFVKSRSRVLPVGVEDKFIIDKDSQNSKKGKTILHIGSFTREKNHEVLIRIFNSLIQENMDINLHLVGSGPLLENIKNAVNKLNLNKRVKFFPEKNDTREFFHNADVLALPSLVEGLPGVVLEAMASRLPVIAYNVGGISEILTAETGYLVSPGNENEFASKLIESLTMRPEALLDNAQSKVRSDYLNKKLAIKFENEYYELISKLKA